MKVLAWAYRYGLLLLIAGVAMPGCESAGSLAGGSGDTDNAEVYLVRDLHALGVTYHKIIDTQGKGPAGWDEFRQFAQQDGLDPEVFDRIQAAGYQFTWGFDPRSGASMSDAVLAQSSAQRARLMADGSLAGVPAEMIEQARKLPRLAKLSSANTAAAPAPPPPPPPPAAPAPAAAPASTPNEQAVQDFLALSEEYFNLLGQIRDLPSAQTVEADLRALDPKFDEVGDRLAQAGDGLANPKYRDALSQVAQRDARETQRLGALPDAEQINTLFLRDAATRGPLGLVRVLKKVEAAQSRQGSPSAAASAPGPSTTPLSPSATAGSPAPSAAPSTPQARTWSDPSGKFRVQATLVSHNGEQVVLRKEDGSELTVPLARLSASDRAHLAELGPAAGGTFAPGALVEVHWGSSWYPAVVRNVDGARYFIHYDNHSDNWDEWVGPDRIRSRPK